MSGKLDFTLRKPILSWWWVTFCNSRCKIVIYVKFWTENIYRWLTYETMYLRLLCCRPPIISYFSFWQQFNAIPWKCLRFFRSVSRILCVKFKLWSWFVTPQKILKLRNGDTCSRILVMNILMLKFAPYVYWQPDCWNFVFVDQMRQD